MKSTHNTIRAMAIGIGLTLLVVTGTAAMMAAFSAPPPVTDMYRRVAIEPVYQPVQPTAFPGHDNLLYERVTLADGTQQWMLTGESTTSLTNMAQQRGHDEVEAVAGNSTPANDSIYAGGVKTVSYTLLAKPAGLNKILKNCNGSSVDAYALACVSAS
ncbi:MAG: hypothetical protein Q7T70_12940 [Polaromonas sp.]|nr:hypothetical protein [Polaromonas sp.]